jgi:hypothetical protein
MATYYARKAGNINATDVWATAPGGTASAVTFASGDVLVSNSFAIAINVSTDLGGSGQLRNDTFGGATAGGTFTLAAGLTLTANILQNNVIGGATVVTCTFNAPLSASIVGNVTSPVNTSGNNRPVSLTGSGTLNFTGNATGDVRVGGVGGAIGNTAGGTINFVGTATGGGGASGYALENAGAGTINITGNCLGATGAAVQNAAGGTINITGNATGGSASGGSGVNNAAGGVIAITGNATGGVSGPGVTNASSGSVTATRAVGNGFGLGSVGLTAAPGIANSGNAGVVEVRELEYGLRGMSPVTGFVRLKKDSLNQAIFNWVDTGAAKILVDATQGEMPAVGNVRLGVSYASGALTGTCAVPSPATVATGVPIDATVGTAALSVGDVAAAVWGAASRTITGGTVDTLTNPPIVPTVVQIREEMDSNSTKLANLDASVSSRLASASYTAPANSDISAIKAKTDNLPASPAAVSDIPTADIAAIKASTDNLPSDPADQSLVESAISALSIPTAASVASAVRTELTELSNLDASVSSRLAGSAYTAPSTPPTAGDIASAVWAAADKTGYSLTSAERSAIAAAVEASILNEGDGQAVLNAIVAAIGNSNVDQIALVAAIRADLERTGGKLINLDATISSRLASADYNAPTSAPTAASVANAVWSAATRTTTGGTVDTLTNAPASVTPTDIWSHATRTLTSASGPTAIEIRQELDSNSTQLAGIKSKTDNLPASPAATGDIPSANISAIKAKTDLLETTRLAQCSTVATTGAQLAAALS